MRAFIVAAAVVALMCQGGLGQRLTRILFVRLADLGASAGGHQLAVPMAPGDHPIEIRRENYGETLRALRGVIPRAVAVGDLDDDGEQDFYIPRAGQNGLLLRGTPSGSLHDLSREIGGGMEDGLAAVFSDYDHSGRQSLFIAGRDGIALYHNNSHNRFFEVTQKAGLRLEPGLVCAGIAIGDFDADGFPDLVVAAYTNLNQPPSKPVFTFPNDFTGVSSRLYRNNGDGTFTDVTQSAGLGGNPGRARKAIVADFNQDKRPDILLLRDDKPPVLYRNRGGWKFDDVTWDSGDDLTTHAFFEGATADFNRDGLPDLVLWSTHSCRLLINKGNAVFKRLVSASIPEPEISVFGFRGLVGDWNSDGFDDLITVDQAGRLRAFVNHDGKFAEVSLEIPQDVENGLMCWFPGNGRKSIYVLANQSDGHLALFRSKIQ